MAGSAHPTPLACLALENFAEPFQFYTPAADSEGAAFSGNSATCCACMRHPSWQKAMWCKTCRQDVPGLLSAAEKHFSCARCGSVLAGLKHETAAVAVEHDAPLEQLAGAPGETKLPLSYDPWAMNEKLRHVGRLLKHPAPAQPAEAAPAELRRIDPPQAPAGQAPAARRPRNPIVGAVAWTFLALGVAGFTCGGALTIWSLIGGREQLWNLGLPIILVGQLALLLGLVLHLDVLWQSSQQTENQLHQVDEQLEALKRQMEVPPRPHQRW